MTQTYDRQTCLDTVILFSLRGRTLVTSGMRDVDDLRRGPGNYVDATPDTFHQMNTPDVPYTLVVDSMKTYYSVVDHARSISLYQIARGVEVAWSMRGQCFDRLVCLDTMSRTFRGTPLSATSLGDHLDILDSHVGPLVGLCPPVISYQEKVRVRDIAYALRALGPAGNVTDLGWNNDSSSSLIYSVSNAVVEANSILAKVDVSARVALVPVGDVAVVEQIQGRRVALSSPCKVKLDDPVFLMSGVLFGKARLRDVSLDDDGRLSATISAMSGGRSKETSANNADALAATLRDGGFVTSPPFITSSYAPRTILRRWGHDENSQPHVTRSLHIPAHIAAAGGPQ